MIIGPVALATLGSLLLLVAEEPAASVSPVSSVSPGDVVASARLTAGCPTGELATQMNPAGLAESTAAIARMNQAHCKAIAPETRLLVTAPAEKGAIRVQQVSGIGEPLFVLVSDFEVLTPRR